MANSEHCKIKDILSNDSVSQAREVINANFRSLTGCIQHILTEISEDNDDIPPQLIFPPNPQDGDIHNITYNGGDWYVTLQPEEETGNVYWLLGGETLNIGERKQHIVVNNMIQEAGSTINISPTGELIIL